MTFKSRKRFVLSFISVNVIHLKSQRTYTGGGALQGSALLDHALGSRRTPEHALRYMHYKTTHKPPRPVCIIRRFFLIFLRQLTSFTKSSFQWGQLSSDLKLKTSNNLLRWFQIKHSISRFLERRVRLVRISSH